MILGARDLHAHRAALDLTKLDEAAGGGGVACDSLRLGPWSFQEASVADFRTCSVRATSKPLS